MRHNGNKHLHLINSKMNITRFIILKNEWIYLYPFQYFLPPMVNMFLVGLSRAERSAFGPVRQKTSRWSLPAYAWLTNEVEAMSSLWTPSSEIREQSYMYIHLLTHIKFAETSLVSMNILCYILIGFFTFLWRSLSAWYHVISFFPIGKNQRNPLYPR